jgi:hypothetical protein
LSEDKACGVRFLVVLLAVALSSLVSGETAAEQSSFMFGMVAYHIPLESYRLDADDMSRISAAGAGWIAVDFAWKDIEEKEGSYDFSYFDFLVSEAEKHGLSIFARVGNGYDGSRAVVPEWTRSLSRDEYNRHIRSYAYALSERYGDRIDYYAIENEPNSILFHVLSGWRSAILPEDEVLKTMGEIEAGIRSGDDDAIIALSVSMSPGYMDWIDWAKEWVDFDVVALNAYKSPFVLQREIEKLRNAGYEVIVLETGLSTAYKSEAEQADFVRDAIVSAYNAGARGVFIYQYRDNDEEVNRKERFFGLINSEGLSKIAIQAYSEAMRIIEAGETISDAGENIRDRLSLLTLDNRVISWLIETCGYTFTMILLTFPPIHVLFLRLMDHRVFSRIANPLRI